jgi:hypothetical protein
MNAVFDLMKHLEKCLPVSCLLVALVNQAGWTPFMH